MVDRTQGSILGLLLLVAALAGCASMPKVQVASTPARPQMAPASFRLTSTGPVERLVSARLVGRGFTEAPADAAATYTVQCAYAVRPLAVGAYIPGDTPANAPKAVFSTASKPKPWPLRKRQAYSLTVDISDTATGKSVFRIRADSVARIDKAPQVAAQLVAAAFAQES